MAMLSTCPHPDIVPGPCFEERVLWIIYDSGLINRKPHARISKFEPGDHYYVLETKFDSMLEAVQYAESNGYRTHELIRVPVPLSGG